MPDIVKKFILAGAGLLLATADKAKDITDELVKKGELTEKEARETLEELRRNWDQKLEEIISAMLARLNLPSRREWEELREKVKDLEQTLKKITDAPPQA